MDIDKKMMGRFDYKRFVRWVIVVAIFFFLGKMVWDNWSQVGEMPFAFKILPFVFSVLLFALSYFIQIWAWYLITVKLGIALSLPETVVNWFYSQLGKYLPGKVWLLLGRLHFYHSKGRSKKATSVALYFETVTMMVAAGLLFVFSLLFVAEARPFASDRSVGWLLLFFGVAFVLLHPRLLTKILNGALILLKKEPVALSISYPDVLRILSVSTLAWGVGGMGFYFFVYSVFPVSTQSILFLTGALAFSSTLGLIALFAPSGLGVREGALVYLLSALMPAPVAVVISVLTRLWTTFIEIGLIGMVYLVVQWRNRGEGKTRRVQT